MIVYAQPSPKRSSGFAQAGDAITRTQANEKTGQDEEHRIPFLKSYFVFNVEQIDGLPAQFHAQAQGPQQEPAQRIARADAFFAATGANITHGGNRAYYSISTDEIRLPPFESFRDAESYYATLGHECIHYAAFRVMPRRSPNLQTGVQRQRGMSA
jgi:antirestriction protein ArdC